MTARTRLVALARTGWLRAWRIAALGLAAWLLHTAQEQRHAAELSRLPLDLAQSFFPDATRLDAPDDRGVQAARDAQGRFLGSVLTTSPQTDDLVGYSGPNNLLVALDPQGRVAGIDWLWSRDTEAHVRAIREHEGGFAAPFLNWQPNSEPPPTPAVVSGSTLTSLALAEGLQRRLSGVSTSLRFPDPVTLEEVRDLVPDAARVAASPGREGWFDVFTTNNERRGFVVRTAPHSDNTRGYRGPTESLVAIRPDGRTLASLRIRRSYDTPDYVDRVREDTDYLAQLIGWDVEQWADLDFRLAGLEGVSGATQTSYAVAEGLRQRFAAEARARALRRSAIDRAPNRMAREGALLALVVGGVVLAFSPWRGRPRVRRLWQVLLVAAFGLWLGDLLSVALLVGWARHGVPWEMAPGLIALTAVALLVPWATRRQVYCHQLCPHGAVQEWLGGIRRWRITLPTTLDRWLCRVPSALLVIAGVLAFVGWSGDLAAFEPFDAWAWRAGAYASGALAVAGLAASLLVPQAYCRYGCPTGALLRFVRVTGQADRFGARDATALALLALGALATVGTTWLTDNGGVPLPAQKVETHLAGTAFGTSWNVRVRPPTENPARLRDELQGELEQVESSLSHWRPDSATSRFNESSTTEPLALPPELVELVGRAREISRATDGAFDVTIAPLAQALGFGPGATPGVTPSPADLDAARARTGWTNLSLDLARGTLAKAHPDLQLDLGALLQGYAADQLTRVLSRSGFTRCLVEVGGELRATGTWDVAVEDPLHPGQPLVRLRLSDAALATSGVYRGSIRGADGAARRHILDPRSGRPIDHASVLVAVISPLATDADAWATALLVLGEGEALGVADQNGIAALIASQSPDGTRLNLLTSQTWPPTTGQSVPQP